MVRLTYGKVYFTYDGFSKPIFASLTDFDQDGFHSYYELFPVLYELIVEIMYASEIIEIDVLRINQKREQGGKR